jgi:nitroreductase
MCRDGSEAAGDARDRRGAYPPRSAQPDHYDHHESTRRRSTALPNPATDTETQADTRDLVERRYGTEPGFDVGESTDVIDLQLRHRSVRRFLPGDVTDEQLRLIVAAAQSGSTSSNLQAWSIIAVRDRERLLRISKALGGHPYIERASVFLIWVADFQRAAQIAGRRGEEVKTLHYLENTLVSFVDAGIAGQNALLAAESLGFGGVFVGSVRNDPDALVDELALPPYTFPIVGIALGVPDPDEPAGTKPRLPQRAVLHEEQYDAEAWRDAADEYEQTLADYYAGYDRNSYSWAFTLGRRLGTERGLYGRQHMRAWLAAQGLPSE